MAGRRRLKLNLGTDRGHCVREVIEACRKVTGHAIPYQLGPRRPGDPPMLGADASAAKRVLAWSPRFVKAHPRAYSSQ